MKKKVVIVSILIVALLGLAIFAIRPIQRGFWRSELLSERVIEGASVREERSFSILGGLTRLERTYHLSNGDSVVFGRMSAGEKDSAYHMVHSDRLDSREGTIWYYDFDTKFWKTTPLAEMELGTTCIYIDGDAQDYFIYVPIGYEVLENNTLHDSGSRGYLSLKKQGDHWKLMLFGSILRPGEICDYTVAKSGTQEPLLDTAAEHTMKYWSAYCHDGDGRWCYDGYYFPSEANYIPTGENCRYLCMASYLTKSMTWQADTVRMADNFLLVMLDTISLQQNEDGYFPTQPGCQWLIDDYGIPAGFYDTRFNSDLMLIYYEQVRRDGGFEQTLSRYFDFYLDFAENHHYETENGGYLVWDYNHSTVPVHSSLNHQLTEMLVLYRFAEHLDRPELEELADRMLLGIEDTCEGWIKEDGNLHYCYMDGDTFGKEDYDYLTYNDLFTMQKELQSMGRERNEALDQLMEAKLSWMQANGVTGYLQ